MIRIPAINLEIFNSLLLLQGRGLRHTEFERFGSREGPRNIGGDGGQGPGHRMAHGR